MRYQHAADRDDAWVDWGALGGGGSAAGYPDDPNLLGTDLGYDVEFEVDGTSLPSGWSWYNQGTSTWQTAHGHGLLTPQLGAGSDGGQRMLVRSIPSETTWTAYLKVTGVLPRSSGNTHAGLVLRDSSSGKYTAYGAQGWQRGIAELLRA